ncbi:MAG TPA: BrnT family toxin [Pyrinomonadaceae bacterium]|nr:BrnT family toxin [Pyrinomonadaceae bacterium]
MRFEWDEKKAARNLVKHGVSFEEAVTVFSDPLSNTFPDPDHSHYEHRFIIIGAAESGKILVVAHTDDESSVRIISAREATSGERKCYEEN